jgi:hypothetical protein
MMRRLLLLGIFVLSAIPAAHAADQTVLGSSLVIKNPSTPIKRKITVKAKETGTDGTLVGDPVTSGATVTVSANGTVPSTDTFSMPTGTNPENQKPFWTGDAVKGFKYSDSKGANGPVKSAQIKLKNGVFQIKVAVDAKLGAVDVVPPNLGSDGCVLFTIGGGDSYSIQFASGKVTNKGPELFKVSKPTSQGSCVPTTTTTTTSSTTTTTLTLPFIPPPGAAPLRYRDLVFPTVTTTTDIVYGTAVNLSG